MGRTRWSAAATYRMHTACNGHAFQVLRLTGAAIAPVASRMLKCLGSASCHSGVWWRSAMPKHQAPCLLEARASLIELPARARWA
jgi:hypothetical protein